MELRSFFSMFENAIWCHQLNWLNVYQNWNLICYNHCCTSLHSNRLCYWLILAQTTFWPFELGWKTSHPFISIPHRSLFIILKWICSHITHIELNWIGSDGIETNRNEIECSGCVLYNVNLLYHKSDVIRGCVALPLNGLPSVMFIFNKYSIKVFFNDEIEHLTLSTIQSAKQMKRDFGNFRKFDGIDKSFDDHNSIIIVNKSIACRFWS